MYTCVRTMTNAQDSCPRNVQMTYILRQSALANPGRRAVWAEVGRGQK